MFFSKLPNIEYTPNRTQFRFTNEDFVIAKNIFRLIEIDNSAYASDLFAEVELNEGTRPDMLAAELYGDATYDWVILLSNKIKNMKNDWYLSSSEFEKLMNKRYTNFEGVKHWVTKEVKNDIGEIVQPGGLIVNYNSNDPDSFKLRYIKSYNPFVEEYENGSTLLTSVSNYNYEVEQNNKKRKIQLLKPVYLTAFVELFTASVSYSTVYRYAFTSDAKKTLNKASIFNNITL